MSIWPWFLCFNFVEASKKSKYNYVLITGKQTSNDETHEFGKYLQTQSFIKNFKIYPVEIKPYQKLLMNFTIFLKELYVKFVTGAKMTPVGKVTSKIGEEVRDDLCNKETWR